MDNNFASSIDSKHRHPRSLALRSLVLLLGFGCAASLLLGSCAHDTDNHNFNPFLLWLPFLGELSSGSETERLFLCFRH